MCGIAGFWLRKETGHEPTELLRCMGNTLAHRGPDDSGIFFDKNTGLGLSFRRLSIIDLTAEGHQPMVSALGRFTIIFNGEVYNYEAIRAELGSQQWRGHSDTEVMLAAIERWGLEASPVLSAYWSAAEVARNGVESRLRGGDEEIIEQLHEKLADAVRLRMIADVPLGAFLSGGIDSSTVVALMQTQSSRPVKTFTIGFHEEIYNEAPHAKAIASHLGTDHTELYVTPKDAWDVIPLLPSMYDEPFADPSQIPTHLVSRLACRHVTVSLSGDGGDELFGGYDRYFFLNSLWGFLKRVPGPVARGMAKLIRSASPA